ncbi:MAG: hypothetical protein ACLGXA_14650 [Acidobacteriota bacterium]
MNCRAPGDAVVDCGAPRVLSEKVVTGEPYQAQTVTRIGQTMADGNHITQRSTAMIARDSKGRTVRSETLQGIHRWITASGASGQNSQTTLTVIFDPIAGERIDYTSDSFVAHVFEVSAPGTQPSALSGSTSRTQSIGTGPAVIGIGPAPGAQEGGVALSIAAFPPGSPPSQTTTTTSSLGTNTIAGVQATGTRVTTTIPDGAIGNDHALVITEDTWYSPELKMVLASTHSDPRFGVTTYSVTTLQREEPPPGLFEVPPGYTVRKVNGQAMIRSDDGGGPE